jgi:hypothetical protein
MHKFLLCAIVAARLFALAVPTDADEVIPAAVAADRAHETCDTFAAKVCRVELDAGLAADALASR